jgi:hypothetical protein
MAQPVEPLDAMSKLNFHAQTFGSPWPLAESAAYAGILQWLGTPKEWGQGAGAYGRRFAPALAGFAIHGVLAFSLNSTPHRDRDIFARSIPVSGLEPPTRSVARN